MILRVHVLFFTVQELPLKTVQILEIILLPEYLQIAEFRKIFPQERAYDFYIRFGSQDFLRVAHPYLQPI